MTHALVREAIGYGSLLVLMLKAASPYIAANDLSAFELRGLASLSKAIASIAVALLAFGNDSESLRSSGVAYSPSRAFRSLAHLVRIASQIVSNASGLTLPAS